MTSKQHAKASAFWARKAELRKQPGHCPRCARAHAGPHRQCPACLAKAAERRQRERVRPITNAADITSEMDQFRRELNKLRVMVRNMADARRESYLRGFMSGQRNYRRNRNKHLKRYFDAYPTASTQELAQISHAYGP